MTLERQAKEIARAINHYSTSFSIEPSDALRKPFSVVIAAYYLAVLSQSEQRAVEQGDIQERPEYNKQGFDHNKHGDPTRTIETAVIPLGHLAENPEAQTKLMDVIDQFRE